MTQASTDGWAGASAECGRSTWQELLCSRGACGRDTCHHMVKPGRVVLRRGRGPQRPWGGGAVRGSFGENTPRSGSGDGCAAVWWSEASAGGLHGV